MTKSNFGDISEKINIYLNTKTKYWVTYMSHWLSTKSLFGTHDCPFDLQTESHDSPCLSPKWGVQRISYTWKLNILISKNRNDHHDNSPSNNNINSI